MHETRGIPASPPPQAERRPEPPVPAPEPPPPQREDSGGTLAQFVSATRRFLSRFGSAPPQVRIKLPEEGNLRLFKLAGEIDDRMALQAATWLIFVQTMNPGAEVAITIDSPGGSVAAGLSLIDVMLKSTCRVSTHCPRQALGIASFVLAAGTKGSRTTSASAILSVPGATGSGKGKTAALLPPKFVEMVSKATGRPPREVQGEILKLKTFTPKQAVKYGIADGVGV
jgi:ATP-dependent Clp protease protease subunit